MMNKALLDRTPLWEIRPEEQVIPDINSLQTDNSREQAKLYYEANKEEIWTNTLRKKEKEIERLNNIIEELEKYIHNELVLDFYNDDMPCELIINKMEKMIKELKENNNE